MSVRDDFFLFRIIVRDLPSGTCILTNYTFDTQRPPVMCTDILPNLFRYYTGYVDIIPTLYRHYPKTLSTLHQTLMTLYRHYTNALSTLYLHYIDTKT